MPKTYVSYDQGRSVEGPFDSPEIAETYVYDIGCDDSDYELLDESRLKGDEQIEAPHIQFIDVRIQINNLHASTTPQEVLRNALSGYNEGQGSGATLYIAEC